MSKLWSKKYNLKECRGCGNDKIPHFSRGFCRSCHNKNYYKKNPKKRQTKNDAPLIWKKSELYAVKKGNNVYCPYCSEIVEKDREVRVPFEGTCFSCFRDFIVAPPGSPIPSGYHKGRFFEMGLEKEYEDLTDNGKEILLKVADLLSSKRKPWNLPASGIDLRIFRKTGDIGELLWKGLLDIL